jgi:LysM repeat protein
MQTRIRLAGMILFSLAATLVLAACVRPYPGGPEAQAQPVPELIATPADAIPLPTAEFVPDQPVEPVDPLPPEATPEVVEEPTPAPIEQDTVHTVVAGDTLFKIATQYGVSLDDITAVNDIPDINRLEIGQQIIIPIGGVDSPSVDSTAPESGDTPADGSEETPETVPQPAPTQQASGGGVHVVQSGENLFRIGLQYGCTVREMSIANNIANPTYIYVGQELIVPDCN